MYRKKDPHPHPQYQLFVHYSAPKYIPRYQQTISAMNIDNLTMLSFDYQSATLRSNREFYQLILSQSFLFKELSTYKRAFERAVRFYQKAHGHE